MSLYKQLTIVLFIICLLAMAVTFWINFANTQSFLINQMQIQTEDSATALGFRLQPDITAGDIAGIETTVNAVFDRGFYSQIRVEDSDGAELFSKEQPILIEGIPNWFSGLFEFEAPVTRRELSAGWALGGLITVAGHPGYAYQQLWDVFWNSIGWYTFGAIALAIVGFLSLNTLLSPLEGLVAQAQSIIERKFGNPLPLPKTKELNTLVSAMNRMTENVKLTFEEHNATAKRLHELAYQDSLTKLGNRRYFDAELKAVLNDKQQFTPITLFLIQVHDFKGFNKRNGYQKGDDALVEIARIISESFTSINNAMIARLGGADFAVYTKLLTNEETDELAENMCTEFADLHSKQVYDVRHVANLGAIDIFEAKAFGGVMSQADAALRKAQAKAANSYVKVDKQDSNESDTILGRSDWKAHLKNLIENESFALLRQRIVASDDSEQVMHWESFVQLINDDGSPIPAGEFFLVAEQMGLSEKIDRWVVLEIVRKFAQTSTDSRESIAMNLSIGSLTNPAFHDWLIACLTKIPTDSKLSLVFENTESVVASHLEQVKSLSTRLQAIGHGTAIDRFGRGFSDFGYLRSLHPIYVKIDPIYTNQATENKDSQFFVSSLRSICRNLDIELIAQNVEDQAQCDLFVSLQVDGIQGFAVGELEKI